MANTSIVITKISHIKKHWEPIRNKLYICFADRLNKSEDWEKIIINVYLQYCNNLPLSISKCSNQEILELLKFFSQYDCPYLFGAKIITTKGNNVSEAMNILSYCLNGLEITIS